MKTAHIYEYRDRLIFVPEHRTTRGINLQGHPLMTLIRRDPDELRKAILGVLQLAGALIPHPTTWKGIFNPILKAAGVRSSIRFYETARCVVVEQTDDAIDFKPLRNVGKRYGFAAMDVRIPSTEKDCGEMLLLALSEAR